MIKLSLGYVKRYTSNSVLIVLDSNHTYAHVRAELEKYASLVTPGSYLVVFDGVMEILADAPNAVETWVTDNPAAAMRDFWLNIKNLKLTPIITGWD